MIATLEYSKRSGIFRTFWKRSIHFNESIVYETLVLSLKVHVQLLIHKINSIYSVHINEGNFSKTKKKEKKISNNFSLWHHLYCLNQSGPNLSYLMAIFLTFLYSHSVWVCWCGWCTCFVTHLNWVSHWAVIVNKRNAKQFISLACFSLLCTIHTLFVCIHRMCSTSSSSGYSSTATDIQVTTGKYIKRNLLLSLHHANLVDIWIATIFILSETIFCLHGTNVHTT